MINAKRDKKDDMQVGSNPKFDLRVSLACHQLERGRVTRRPHQVPRESWAANGPTTSLKMVKSATALTG